MSIGVNAAVLAAMLVGYSLLAYIVIRYVKSVSSDIGSPWTDVSFDSVLLAILARLLLPAVREGALHCQKLLLWKRLIFPCRKLVRQQLTFMLD